MGQKFLLIVGLLLLLPLSTQGADLFIQSVNAPVFKKPSLSGVKLYDLPQGTKVTGLKKEGMWQRIQYNKDVGYIHSLMLAPTPPLHFNNIKSEQIKQMEVTARKRPSSYASTAAARSLVHQRGRMGKNIHFDYDALEKMKSYAANREATLQFIKERELR
jgi:hypothetical protein